MASAVAAAAKEYAGPGSVSLEICEVGSRRDRDDFIRLPWSLYRHDRCWVPPLVMERKEFLDSHRHPFYRHGEATLLLARLAGRPVARVLVSIDPRYNAAHGANTGCFGLFESIDDARVAQALLDQAARWLQARGCTQILGPIDYSTNYSCGLLIDGFDQPPRIFMNHNPPYYAGLLESWGLVKAKDLYAWWFNVDDTLCKRFGRLAARIERQGEIQVRPFRKNDKDAEVERCKHLYNQAWEHNWGFVPMSDAEFEHFVSTMFKVLTPDYLLLAEAQGEAVGFSLSLPDFNEAIQPLNGRLFQWGLPIGLWKFLRNCRRIHTARLVALGVLERYRRRGISELLILRTTQIGLRMGTYQGAELGWTLEDNVLINHTIEAVGGQRYKTYRIYEKKLAPATSASC